MFLKENIRYDCKPSQFSIPNIRSGYNGSKTLSYLGLEGKINKSGKWWVFTSFGCRELIFQWHFKF